ncbi:type 2 isopentenyl-diphosphate Delta-isomerase [Bacillus marinisedimentorum]|uniref:type 2 isopentenyl-diphosphate Delta-isomerase n=1 Tax=Bacillus marinisedimentorum TaxID=1821260 RepID=UPI0008726A06|nr:type 2 isopentenyl-diphosphate Delta-isomerase [Bacillus marinisedimentorum]
MSRSKRKLEHIKYALETRNPVSPSFEDIRFVHRSLPESDVNKVELRTNVGELTLSSPIIVNAMTGGGGRKTEELNGMLARTARRYGLPIAVGSQMSALKDPAQTPTFKAVRRENPDGLVFANLGCEASYDQAMLAVEMLEADALQLHANTVQELVMPEGDRSFSGWMSSIEKIARGISVPVIVKEVGFGMGRETAKALKNAGVSIIDIGGSGGTNFARVENKRRLQPLQAFEDWGIPTPVSIVEAGTVSGLGIIGSGGISTPLQAAKAISLGASAAGVAGHFLSILVEEGEAELNKTVEFFLEEFKLIMAALGTEDIKSLKNAPVVILGETREWLNERGVDTRKFSLRS